MGRKGRTKDQDVSERRCIVTGEVTPKQGLIRFVVGPENQAVPDILEKLPGRGMWVTATRDALDKAGRGHFSKSAKVPVTVLEGLTDEVERQTLRRVVDMIAMARKAGLAVAGFEKVKGWLQMEEAEVLIQAVDGSGRGKSKLSTPHYGHYIGWLTADELGLAFGRQTVIHGALASGGLTSRVVEEAQRLKGVRINEGGNGHPKG